MEDNDLNWLYCCSADLFEKITSAIRVAEECTGGGAND
jgi:hypothetical protein